MNERKLKQLNLVVLLALVTGIVCIVIFASFFVPKYQNRIEGGTLKTFNESWMLRNVGGNSEMIDLPKRLSSDAEDIITIMHLVPENVNEETVLMFRTEFQNVVVTLNDHTIYTYGVMNDQKMVKNAVPCNNVVSLADAKPGDVIAIYFVSAYGKYSGELPDIYVGTRGDVVSTLIKRSGPSFLLSVLLIIVTLVLFISLAFMNKGEVDKRKYAYAFTFVCATALWSLTGNEIMQLFTKNMFGVYMANIILLLLLPVLYLMHLRCYAVKRRFAGIFEIGIYFFGVMFLTGLVFQFLNVMDFALFLGIAKLLMVLGLILLTAIMYLASDGDSDRSIHRNMASNMVLTVACITEAICSLVAAYKTYDGLILQIGVYVFVVMLMVGNQRALTKEMYKERDVALASAEEEKSRIVKKLNTGFIYQSINTAVNDLKETDPANSKLLYDSSMYLRYNLRTVGDRKLVSFGEELAYIKAYLGMQQRNHPGLEVLIEDKITDFSVPFNTVEPLVENSVVNGSLERGSAGKIVVRSYERLDCYAIQIVDNGKGLGPDKRFTGKQSFKSIRKALKSMCGAAIEINSKPEKGTIITVKVPKSGYVVKE